MQLRTTKIWKDSVISQNKLKLGRVFICEPKLKIVGYQSYQEDDRKQRKLVTAQKISSLEDDDDNKGLLYFQ